MPRLLARKVVTGLALSLVLAGMAGAAVAQTPPGACPPNSARVRSVYKEVPQPQQQGNGAAAAVPVKKIQEAELRDTITVEVDNLACLLQQSQAANKPVVLYLDDRPVADTAAFPPTDPELGLLRFPLQRSEASRDVWTYILGRPQWDFRPTKVSVGLQGQYAIPSDSILRLYVIPHGWFIAWSFLFGGLVLGFFFLARNSELLRDPVADPGGDKRRPYSLSRTQAAWWFFLILASYLLIGMVTGDFSSSITGTVLVLLGISAGTTVSSAFVDASKDTPEAAQQEAAAKADVQARLTQIDQAMPNATPPQARALTAEKVKRISELRKLNNESEQFLKDILSDANGVNFHRFQIVAWTIVLGIIFAAEVYRDLAMPQFSGTLLSLMGISAGTYVGLKIPEDTVPK